MNNRIKPTVCRILENEPETRADDNLLIIRVIQELEPELAGSSFVAVMNGLKFRGISMESITRARRKFLEIHPGLKDKEATKFREVEEENYIIEYGKHVPRID